MQAMPMIVPRTVPNAQAVHRPGWWLAFLLLMAVPAARGAVTVYTDEAAFEAELAAGAYVEDFTDPTFDGKVTYNFSGPSPATNAYTAAVSGTYLYQLTGGFGATLIQYAPDITTGLSTLAPEIPLSLTLTSGNVSALGGVFFLNNDSEIPIAGDFTVKVTESDETTTDFPITSTSTLPPFRGFVSDKLITKVELTAAAGTPDNAYYAVTHLSVGYVGGGGCGPGIALTTGSGALWKQLALPCVPTTATVQGALGAGTTTVPVTGNLVGVYYANSSNWWRLYYYNASTPQYVMPPNLTDPVSVGTGYWIKSFDAPGGGGNLNVTGTATTTDATQAQGCAVAAGCKAIGLYVAANRYNMIGNPFPYNVDWAQVRIEVDGTTILTPTEAQTAGYLDKRIWIWNGNSYATFDDSTPGMIGNLKYFQSFWVKVLPGAVTHTLRLLIPAAASTHSQLAPTGSERLAATRPWYQSWLDALIPPAGAAELALPPDAGQQTPGRGPERRPAPGGAVGPAPTDPTIEMLTTMGTSDGLDPAAAEQAAHAQAQAEGREWYLRLKVDEPATGYRDHNSVLGQLLTAKNGRDPADLGEMPPFATPYLTLVFPHPEWGTAAGDYASDFRSAQRLNSRNKPVAGLPAADWAFEIRTDRPGTPVVLTWEGPPEILKRSRLIDRATGRALIPTAKAYAKGYRVTLTSGKGAFIWRFLGQP